jgi:hypothetical protein
MTTLALDLATVTGWALHDVGMDKPHFGTLTLPYTPEEVGPPMAAIFNFLDEKHAIWKFTDVVFEAQHMSAKMDMRVVYKLVAYGAAVELWCYDNGLRERCYQVHISTWRKHFLGVGNLKRDEAKIKCLAVCQRLGWNTVEADAAEAMGILDYFLSLNVAYERPWRDRMLAGGLVS